MTGEQLCAKLGIDRRQLTAWLKEGLPHAGTKRKPTFDPAAVRAWLVEHGYAAAGPSPAASEPRGALAIRAHHGDREAIVGLAGGGIAKSIPEVARWFDVSPTTIKTGWRKAGDMPGEEGNWPLDEILRWKLNRDVVPAAQTDSAKTARQTALDRKREADARKAEADAAAKELKNELTAGNLMYRADVEREVSEHLAVARHTLLRIPAQLIPMLPKEHAAELAERIKGEIERTLAVLADVEPALTGEQ